MMFYLFFKGMSRRKLRFYTPKNWERKLQQQRLLIKIPRKVADRALLFSQMKSVELEGWTKLYVSSTGSIARICKYDHSTIPSKVLIMVDVEDNACKVYAGSKAVPLYDKAVSSISELLFILEQLNTYSICPAIDDPKFKPLIEKHGGLFYDCHGKKVAIEII